MRKLPGLTADLSARATALAAKSKSARDKSPIPNPEASIAPAKVVDGVATIDFKGQYGLEIEDEAALEEFRLLGQKIMSGMMPMPGGQGGGPSDNPVAAVMGSAMGAMGGKKRAKGRVGRFFDEGGGAEDPFDILREIGKALRHAAVQIAEGSSAKVTLAWGDAMVACFWAIPPWYKLPPTLNPGIPS